MSQSKSSGKGRPTAKRKAAQQKNKRPIVGESSPAHSNKPPQVSDAVRVYAQAGFARGDERFLPPRDRGEQRRFVRDFVDNRYNITEFIVPAVVVVIALSFFAPLMPRPMQLGITYAWFFILFLVFIDQIVLRTTLSSRLKKKFGTGNIERGLPWYASSRSIQPRLVRMPRPQHKRGQFPK